MRLFLLCSFIISSLYATSQLYSLSGSIIDEINDEVIPNAIIEIHELKLRKQSDINGFFKFENLKQGNYHMHVYSNGYEEKKIIISLKANYNLSIKLYPSVIELPTFIFESEDTYTEGKKNSLFTDKVESSIIAQEGGNSFSNALEKLPGLNSVNTGVGISKPMIRGLFNNRIIVNELGIKQEGQQWGSDHGLEIDQWNVGRVEVVKGPASLLYGSDGLGGVINILPDFIPQNGEINGEIIGNYRNNNKHYGGSGMLQANHNNIFAKLRYSYSSFADYKVPASEFNYNSFILPIFDERLKNTAGNQRNIAGTIGILKDWGNISLTISDYKSRVGLFPGATGRPTFYSLVSDGDIRGISLPSQEVNHLKVISNAQLITKKGWIKMDFGYQNNLRYEYSNPHAHGGQIIDPEDTVALGLELNTFTFNLRYYDNSNIHKKWIYGMSAQYQNNKKNGFEYLIPDYNQFSNAFFAYFENEIDSTKTYNLGARIDYTFQDAEGYSSILNNEIWERSVPINNNYINFAISGGYTWYPNHYFNVKTNMAKTYRVPQVVELSANGVHHGSFRHEQGSSNLKSEHGYQVDVGLVYHKHDFVIKLTPYFNFFKDYIYLSPSGNFSPLPDAGQIYKYEQHDGIYTGFELYTEWHPIDNLHLEFTSEYVWNYNLETNLPFPFTPPLSLKPSANYTFNLINKTIEDVYFGVDYNWYASQNRVERNELATEGYQIFNAKTGAKLIFKDIRFELYFNVKNIFDIKYYNHLSRYRILNLPEQGRNFVITLKVPFDLKK